MNNPFDEIPQANISRRNPLYKTEVPIVSYIILGITIIVYILQVLTQNLLGYDLPAVLGMKINEYILEGQLWRLFTPMFLHGSLIHIGFNMYALVRLGMDLEKRLGHGRYLLLYVAAGFAGNVMSFIFSPYASLGASTSIFGLLGAEAVYIYQNRSVIYNSRGLLNNILQVAAINIFIGLSSNGIDNWGHIGGLIGGAVFAWFANPKFEADTVMIVGNAPIIQDVRGANDTLIGTVVSFAIFTLLAFWGFLR